MTESLREEEGRGESMRFVICLGMVLLQKTEELPKAVERFEGTVLILYHNTLVHISPLHLIASFAHPFSPML